ncbi:MAG: DEAD/DEAH box helicase [Gammaproteobacteria bacterium]|nr:DEAD/DEAH box helicase [Gammaproteobacteria bacterium]
MSFLAQLRQQQPAIDSSLRLCYLLEIQPSVAALKLRLALVDLRRTGVPRVDKPYRIQRLHLQHPPPFMSPEDVRLLNILLTASPDWLQQTQGYLPVGKAEVLIPLLLKTQRTYLITPQDRWRKLSLGNPVPVNLGWVPEHSGVYHLKWRALGTWKLFVLDADAVYPVAYDANLDVLAPAQQNLGPAALDALKQAQRALAIDTIDAFLSDNEEAWTALGLPLPMAPTPLDRAAELSPVLRFTSNSVAGARSKLEDCVSLMFRYSSESYCACIPFADERDVHDYSDGVHFNRISRNRERETWFHQRLLSFMNQFDSSAQHGVWRSEQDSYWRQLLTESRPELEREGFQFSLAPGFRRHFVVADRWQLEIEDAETGFLSVNLFLETSGGIINLFDLLGQLQAFNCRQTGEDSVLPLADGRLLLLPTQKLSGIVEELGDLLAKQTGTLRLPLSQISRLEGLRRCLPESTQRCGAVAHLEFATSLHQTPAMLGRILDGVEAELRSYQWLGVCWLQHLKRHRVNGLLADDMGLGKTLQTLAHLSLERQQGQLKDPALIVAPTSLLHNWAAEIRRFTPHLRYKIVHGAKRRQCWGKLQEYDVLITSYPLIVNDLRHWQEQALSWIILDEAQQIKNSRTQVSQALRQIACEFRICLSGTPVQNHLGELWSLLDFLMPGCLGDYADFRRYYKKPIEQEANEARMAQLQTRIAPFLLRRTKDQVATDLPAKTEICQYISLNEDQRLFYDEQKSAVKLALQEQLAETPGGGQRQVLLLTALLKLRQTCCDPKLLGAFDVSSAKREHCIEMVEELVEEQRSILLFSQFTSMLDLLAQDLDDLNIRYLKLTGKSRDRETLVEAFQRGDAPVFLISLKAGGVGLNLTRADTVIHYDPWWNQAAELQATDRAHRIGQDKPVFIYRLISENTIEEKITELQRHKAQISQHINHQAQISGRQFALKLEDLMVLWQQETATT